MHVDEELPEWEDSRTIGRKRKWFTISEALVQLAQHKPVQRSYIHSLKNTNPRRGTTNNPSSLNSHQTPIQLVTNNSTTDTHITKNS